MNVKVKLVNKHKSATADLWHYSGQIKTIIWYWWPPGEFTIPLCILVHETLFIVNMPPNNDHE